MVNVGWGILEMVMIRVEGLMLMVVRMVYVWMGCEED